MNFKFKFIAFAILVLVVSCAKNPFTGKSTMALVPNSQIFPSAFQQYNQFLSENKVIKGTADAKRIETIGFKIKTASERWLTAHNQADYLKVAKQITCKNEEHLKSFLQEIEKGGGEGVVVRNPDTKYIAKRDPNSLKIKSFQDAECEVVEHHKGEGKYKNSFGSLTCRNDEGVFFDIGSGFSEVERKNPPAIGSKITYKFQEITKGGKPRFPVYMRIKEEI